MDIAPGYCDFINNLAAPKPGEKRGRHIAVDLNPDVHAAPFVKVHNTPAQDLGFLGDSCIDAVFVSNFFEHIKYLPGEYWDFFEHYTPLTEKSMCEAIGKFWENKCLYLPGKRLNEFCAPL